MQALIRNLTILAILLALAITSVGVSASPELPPVASAHKQLAA